MNLQIIEKLGWEKVESLNKEDYKNYYKKEDLVMAIKRIEEVNNVHIYTLEKEETNTVFKGEVKDEEDLIKVENFIHINNLLGIGYKSRKAKVECKVEMSVTLKSLKEMQDSVKIEGFFCIIENLLDYIKTNVSEDESERLKWSMFYEPNVTKYRLK
jgi:hypothetical protein